MTDKVQKIREEVVRLHNLLPVMDGDNISVNYADRICTALKMYIDSLQEEPVNEDLEVEIKRYLHEVYDRNDTVGDIARHFAKWQKEKFEKDYTNLCNGIATAKGLAVATAYDKGKADEREQLMKDAYDAYVSYIRDNSEAVVFLKNTSITMPCHFSKRDLEEGDKLKIVIVKSK